MEISIDAYEADMVNVYTKDNAIKPYAKMATEFVEGLVEGAQPGMKTQGNSLEYRLKMNDAFSLGMPADGGDWPRNRRHRSVKASVTRSQLAASLSITLEGQAAAEGAGSFSGNPVREAVENCLRVFMWHKNVKFLGHGTGRLAVVAGDVAASDTIVCDLPWSLFALEEGLFIEFTEQDVGGTVQDLGGGIREVEILELTPLTHTIRVSEDITVGDGWGIYVATTYGQRHPNGLQAIIDNGRLTATIFGINRASFPKVNATVLDNSGALQDYNEDLIRDGLTQARQRTKMIVTEFWSNAGVIDEHYRFTAPDRMFQVAAGDGAPSYQIGAKGEIGFHYAGRMIPFKMDPTLPTRQLYGAYKPGFRRHTLIEDDWLKGGGGAGGNSILHWAPADGGNTLSNRMIGTLQGNSTLSHNALHAQILWDNIRDRHLARD